MDVVALFVLEGIIRYTAIYMPTIEITISRVKLYLQCWKRARLSGFGWREIKFMQYTVETGIPLLVDFWSLTKVKDSMCNITHDKEYLDVIIDIVSVVSLGTRW